MGRMLASVILTTLVAACGGGGGGGAGLSPNNIDNPIADPSPAPVPAPTATPAPLPTAPVTPTPIPGLGDDFTAADAKNNLIFANNQYLKMLAVLEDDTKLEKPEGCGGEANCFPRSINDGKLVLKRPNTWSNGFISGILWKLLRANESLSVDMENTFSAKAKFYSDAILDQALRTDTHDLGFIINNSLGEALKYSGLDSESESVYQLNVNFARGNLATRHSSQHKTIRSWDWTPNFKTKYLSGGSERFKSFDLRAPWQYPVIIDGMMNLELLLDSDNQDHINVSYEHATSLYNNHYYYLENDVNKERPIAYHVYDYDSMRPGNWQGLGNISAWSRGQAWSLYGFAIVAEHINSLNQAPSGLPDFNAHIEKLYNSMEYLLMDDPVPLWDYFADDGDASTRASNAAVTTSVYSRMLDLCDHEIPGNILPYEGWGPIEFRSDILTNDAIAELGTYETIAGESFLVAGNLAPCGTAPFNTAGRFIPKDSSAAAVIAAGLYRMAQFATDNAKKSDYISLADKIMATLSAGYLTNINRGVDFDLGFVLKYATGNLPASEEINTSIIYGDYYFIEANMRKLALEEGAR